MAVKGTFGFDELRQWFGISGIPKELRAELIQAHNRVGQLYVARTRQRILRDKPFVKNSPVTVAMKGSSTPLVDDGDLVGSIAFRVEGFSRVVLGVRSPRTNSGRFLYEILHNGATITVTPSMRRAVMAKLSKRLGPARMRAFSQQWFRGPAKIVWIIPGRPFITDTLNAPEFRRAALNIYARALESAIQESKP